MASLPYMQFYPSDWMGDCQILTLAARGAWQTIICKAWHPSTRGVVSLKLSAFARLFGATVEQAEKVIAEIEEMHIADVERDGDVVTVTCRRVVRDWLAAEARSNTLSASGQRGAKKRWGGHSHPNGQDNGVAIERPIAIQNPESRSQQVPPLPPRSEPRPSVAEREFEEFYLAYPKKRSRGDAWKAWRTLHPPLQQCLESIEKLKQTEEWRKERGQFIPHPATWIRAQGWLDVPEAEIARRKPRAGIAAEEIPDPPSWPEFTALYPALAGHRFTDLPNETQESFKAWSFEKNRIEFQEHKKLL